MKIYTKTGDDGTTGLFAGPRVFKDDERIAAYGSVDELNSVLGLVVVCAQANEPSAVDERLSIARVVQQMQHELFAIGAELATPQPAVHGTLLLGDGHIAQLEQWIDQFEESLEPLANFILPGGTQLAALLHWARTVCRRAERDVVHFLRQTRAQSGNRLVIYLNRASDLLFVLARYANARAGVKDVEWKKPNRPVAARRASE